MKGSARLSWAAGGRFVRRRRREVLIGLLLLAATAAVYAPVRHHDFVNLDDGSDVAASRMVQQGLTWQGLRWAFTSGDESNWFPLTRLSHLLDSQLFGMNAGAHHLVSAGLHLVNSLLVFTVLQALTGAAVAERVRGGAVRAAPAARGVGGVGRGAQGRAERAVLAAHDAGAYARYARAAVAVALRGWWRAASPSG